MTIACDECSMRFTEACSDCIVTFLCDAGAGEAMVVDASERRSLRLLQGAGLAPQLRHVPMVG